MNLRQNQKGFTIVELLIVIVVIAILAAISIVAYTGIQDRAKTSSNKQLASQLEKKAQAYYTVQSNYPLNIAAFASGPAEANLDSGMTTEAVTTTAGAGVTVDDDNSVGYGACDDNAIETVTTTEITGMVIAFWNYETDAIEVRTIGDCT